MQDFFYLQSTVRVAAPLDSLAPMLFSSTQEYRPLSSRLTFLMTREGWSTVAPSYRVLSDRSKSWPLRYLQKFRQNAAVVYKVSRQKFFSFSLEFSCLHTTTTAEAIAKSCLSFPALV